MVVMCVFKTRYFLGQTQNLDLSTKPLLNAFDINQMHLNWQCRLDHSIADDVMKWGQGFLNTEISRLKISFI